MHIFIILLIKFIPHFSYGPVICNNTTRTKLVIKLKIVKNGLNQLGIGCLLVDSLIVLGIHRDRGSKLNLDASSTVEPL